MRWELLGQHVNAVRAVRILREEPVQPAAAPVNLAQVANYRQRVSHLEDRLPSDALDRAAYGGLQDTQPRAALLALHGRMEGVVPASWEDRALAQIWFRWADYVVPRSALGAFTLGAAPRDERYRAALDEFADAVLDVLAGQRRSRREVAAAFPDRPAGLVRCLSVTGKVHIRWDASSSEVVPAAVPEVDPSEARLDLARRFLHWYGPVSRSQFAKWAGVCMGDAELTWSELHEELVPVSFERAGRWMLASDVAVLCAAEEGREFVRFLPGGGDPYLQLDRGTLLPDPPSDLGHHYLGSGGRRSVINGLTGRLLLDGKVVGSWGRAGLNVRIAPWTRLRPGQVDRVSEEAATMSGPLGGEPRLSWIE